MISNLLIFSYNYSRILFVFLFSFLFSLLTLFSFSLIFRLFFNYHLYLIYQGQTTNESFKWASVVLTHKRLLKAHDKYLELSRPENIEKIELIERENDELNREKVSDVQLSTEARICNSVVDDYKDDSNNERSNGTNTMKIKNVEKIINMEEKRKQNQHQNDHQNHNQNHNQSDYHDVSDDIRNDENETAISSTKQRSDSTFDGAPSAIIEDVCNCIIRKEGSSSSGSTSSSSCYDYKYADNEDVKYHENDHNFDDNNDSIYWKDSEVNGDGQTDYLEVYSNYSEKQMKRKEADVSIEKEKEIEREWNEKKNKMELSCNESQLDDRCEKISKELIIKGTVNDRVSSALESVQEKEVVNCNEEDATPGCVPSPFPSKSTLPDSEYIFPEYLSKHPGHIPPNCYKIGFFMNLKNILIPPSAVALRVLNENGKRLDLLKINRCDNHNNDNNDRSRASDKEIVMSMDSDKHKTAIMARDDPSKKIN